jgi:hypothetical protein
MNDKGAFWMWADKHRVINQAAAVIPTYDVDF